MPTAVVKSSPSAKLFIQKLVYRKALKVASTGRAALIYTI